jgi:NAD(P)-dependent dehydrogenase (short-subunit alcohol dehydrogenase family)
MRQPSESELSRHSGESVRAFSGAEQGAAIVTGGGRRVGAAIAMMLAGRGLGVVVYYGASSDGAAGVVREIVSAGGRAVAVGADLREPCRAAEKVFGAARELGPVTVLVNSASVFQDLALEQVDGRHCDEHVSVNLLAPIFLSQQFMRQLDAGSRGHIINLLDWRVHRPGADHLVYTATRSALASVTKSLALQLAPRVQVNGVAPGAVLPPEDRPDWHQQRAAEQIPLRRTGSPRDITAAIGFLLDSGFITGEVLNVSGGEEL